MQNEQPRNPRAVYGFTLIELLVAMAIFITVMGSVTLLFNTAVRTTKQGFLNQEAFEMARGALGLIERDINRSFTGRDRGDVEHFYGTPIGFTFIGLISADELSTPNLARITYVIYHLDPIPENPTGAIQIFETIDGDFIPTYVLLRYIEPNAEDLDSFPVDWTRSSDDFPFTMQNVIGDPLNPVPGTAVGNAVVGGLCDADDLTCLEQVEKSKKRELWIAMLAGGERRGGIDVPSAWDFLPEFLDRNLDPLDFVVADNIRYLRANGILRFDPGDSTLPATLLELQDQTDFDDVFFPDIVNGSLQTSARIFGDAASVPQLGPSEPANYSTTSGRVPFFTYRDFGLSTEIVSLFPRVRKNVVKPIELRYWNDRRNIAGDGIDNDGDTVIDELLPSVPEVNSGSPLSARLPIEIGVNFTLFFRSPYPGAPDFNQTFTQRIDLPTGYRRPSPRQ